MLNAQSVQAFLRQFEPLSHVVVEPQSEIIEAPWLVRLHGSVLIYGQPHHYEAELDLKEFGGVEDLMKLAKQLMTSFAGAAKFVQTH